ncbi:hypothetical protein Ahy_B07g086818 [Arachis hypogaea]|uniref:Aminotransferase-like plant mobile domain-containing protein n=1 Tax=Arachis hypogaea TaxID=3818 RepID=A0A444YAK9_ARAHY|nr:hypothetical protein Ahy_B07g086818 [Arachis hypogaea]
MAKKHKARNVDRPELHIVNYLSDPDYSLRMMTCDHSLPPDRYHPSVEDHLRADCRGSGIKLTWLRNLKERIQLTDEISMQRYVKCHIMLLLGTILLGDKSGASVHWKFLPLLRDFHSISHFSWGSACLAHLYRSLCRASRFDCKEIDGPLTLLLAWFWIRLPYLAPPTREPRSFPLANRI